MKFLLMKSSMSGCYYKRQALHGLVATGQEAKSSHIRIIIMCRNTIIVFRYIIIIRISPPTINYLLWGERGVIGRHGK